MAKKILGTALASLVLHLALGWLWTVLAGVIGGYWAPRRGWFVGALGVGLGWLALVSFNFVVAGASTLILVNTLGALVGNTPPALIVAATLLIALLTGALGGWVGCRLAAVLKGDAVAPATQPVSSSQTS